MNDQRSDYKEVRSLSLNRARVRVQCNVMTSGLSRSSLDICLWDKSIGEMKRS